MKLLSRPTVKAATTSPDYSASLIKYLVAVLLIFIPLYPKFPLFFLPRITVAVRFEDLILFLSGLALILYYYRQRIKLTTIPLFPQITTFWLIAALSLFSALFITQTVLPSTGLLHLFRRLEYLLAFFLAYQAVKNHPQNLHFYFKLIIFSSIGVLLYGIAQIYFKAPIISTMNSEFSKGAALTLQPGVPISSTFAGHYDLAVYLSFILTILAALYHRLNKLSAKIFLPLLFLAQLWLLLQTGSRMAVAAAFLSVSLVLLLSRQIKLIFLFWLIFIIAVANTPQLTGRFQSLFKIVNFNQLRSFQYLTPASVSASESSKTEITNPPPQETLRPIQQDRSTSIRLDKEWPRAWRAFLKNPFLGTGYSSITLATDNDYFRALGETGLLGFLSFLALIIAITKKSFNLLKNKTTHYWQSFNLAYLGMLTSMLIIALFLDVFEASKIATLFWLFTGLNLATSKS